MRNGANTWLVIVEERRYMMNSLNGTPINRIYKKTSMWDGVVFGSERARL